jgi:hypothetical protein
MASPDPPRFDQGGPIQSKRPNCGATDGRASNDSRRIGTPAKMNPPMIQARVEEWNLRLRAGIDALGQRLFEAITPKAAPTEVFKAVAAAPRFRHDMIDGEVMSREFCAGLAVFTEVL